MWSDPQVAFPDRPLSPGPAFDDARRAQQSFFLSPSFTPGVFSLHEAYNHLYDTVPHGNRLPDRKPVLPNQKPVR